MPPYHFVGIRIFRFVVKSFQQSYMRMQLELFTQFLSHNSFFLVVNENNAFLQLDAWFNERNEQIRFMFTLRYCIKLMEYTRERGECL